MKTKIISFGNHKGGVGKTTTAASVGSILASKGYHVLLIDLDPQANLTFSMLSEECDVSSYNALIKREPLPRVKVSDHLDIVPSSLELEAAEMELISAISRETILKRLLAPIKDEYDFILVDCRPSLTLLTMNAFAASTDIIVPLVPEVLPFKGLEAINNFIKGIQENLTPETHLSGILITKVEANNLHKNIEDNLREVMKDLVYKTRIRKNITLAEAPMESKDITKYSPKSNGAADYLAFTEELIKIYDK